MYKYVIFMIAIVLATLFFTVIYNITQSYYKTSVTNVQQNTESLGHLAQLKNLEALESLGN